jgi:hypothetical protein
VLFIMVAASPGFAAVPQLFVTSERCMACHNNLQNLDGVDISIGSDWESAIMAHSAKDPYWQASVRRETIDHPSSSAHIQDECAACHMPMMRYREQLMGREAEVFALLPLPAKRPPLGVTGPVPTPELAADGVSCSMCHQIQSHGLGSDASFTAGFRVDENTPVGNRIAFGPYEVDDGRKTVMRSASGLSPNRAAHIQQSALCGSCHTLYTNALDSAGNVIGRLPEQTPYLEWRHSSYVDTDPCQSCHMPVERDAAAVSSVLGIPRDHFSRHTFRGGNFFMLSLFARYADELSVVAPPAALEGTINRTRQYLQTHAASLEIREAAFDGGELSVRLAVRNLAGHKLPSAYPSRRAWIHFVVRDSGGHILFESGRLRPDGSISGNDNDREASSYEPHYDRIDRESQVQIYEGILAGPDDAVTTGLLTAVRYIKDNRLLPDGFDKAGAPTDIAVKGEADADPTFAGGVDEVSYHVPLGSVEGPLRLEAELMYQPIAFRWAHNLKAYNASETQTFSRLYRNNADASAIRLAAVFLEVR